MACKVTDKTTSFLVDFIDRTKNSKDKDMVELRKKCEEELKKRK